MKIKKIIILLISLFIITGCTTTKSYTFKVETGDNIKIKVKTSDGFNISSDVPFEISKEDEVISEGSFITLDGYNYYKNVIASDTNANVIEENNIDNLEYIFYEYKGTKTEYNYVIKVKNSNTGLIIGSTKSKEEASEIFNNLEITKE